jgi:hypothetical protein
MHAAYVETAARPHGLTNHDNRPHEEKIRRAVRKVGPVLETVKKELGIGGAG